MNKMVYLIRHGITRSNIEKVYAGRSQEELTEKGVAQVNSLGKNAKDWGISTVYTSPIRRAVQTAEILNRFIRTHIILEPDFTEMKMGPWEGLPESQIALKYRKELQIWQSQPSKLKLRDRETLQDIQTRALNAINKILLSNSHTNILVVTHVAVIRCLIMYFRKLDLDMYKRIDIPNLSIYQLIFRGKETVVKRIKVAER